MDVLVLLRRAKEAGLCVEPAGDTLKVRGPKNAEPVVKLLAEHKAEVMAALAKVAREAELLSPAPWFERVVTPVKGEPGFESACAARRGRIEELPDGLLLHFCAECGAWGAFGYGVNLRVGRPGRWYCAEHRPRWVSQ
jgi:hypothetical protein